MKQGHLIIAAKEQDYIQRLASYMRDAEFGASWQVTAFSHPPALKQYLKNGYPADLLLAQPVFLEETGELLSSGAVVAELVRQHGGGERGSEVLQFQPLPQLLQQLTALHREAAGSSVQPIRKQGSPLVAAVYSAVGGIGKTTLALHLARAAAMQHKKVFYLNLEQWNAVGAALGDAADDGFSRMLYGLQAQPDQAYARFRELRRPHPLLHCDTFPPPQGSGERSALTGTVAASLLETIASGGEYELIVVDMDSWMDDVYAHVARASQLVFWLCSDDAAVRGKTGYALEQLKKLSGSTAHLLMSRLRMIRVGPEADSRPVTAGWHTDGTLPLVPQWQAPDPSPVPFASPQYRQAVDVLIRQLIWPEGGEAVDRSRGGGAGAEEPYSRAH
ncbi:hypothetical protein [Paenibacillus sp. 1P07SE]|uniref:hypothetical protein n=1 Tax=Paenibacillus sp. 1P07SE TaxID=3132209 RepID=UPI0039A474C7